ncbi:MAG TPA: HEAT repeat domain-containing protein [Baekduia sp.]|uniref:HEAT repeat domain-containing protein n=1 Tax=Baekduia sp. TaxID=2600305 RepID=UPI002D7A0DE2|nr:HEAT repeat domain-containing protein [Baekduia sp.]HET6508429.1 HEAT repeat domain-containing protein [Baekduia sp.]
MIDELFAAAVANSGDLDDRWEPIKALHAHEDPAAVRAAAERRLVSEDPVVREAAVDVLAQVGGPDAPDRPERATLLLDRLAIETHPHVLAALATALMHLRDPRALESLIALAGHEHPLVRRGVVDGLSFEAEDDRAIDALIALSADPIAEIRDWATFTLGHLGYRTGPRVLDALAVRLHDEDRHTSAEALYALALRADPRAVARLLELLDDGWYDGLIDRALVALTIAFPDDGRLSAALAERWPNGVPDRVRRQVEDNLEQLEECARP